ncbi:unnamed protein product [Strongylus vulgaris]|uniref:Uncharacterized protein n=1 Tax=Strongylus vulgaris TaxID=40348 RepID=A0A3P7JIV1_STRVU|nr:unnamed protein product [Strongylus vulgaris]
MTFHRPFWKDAPTHMHMDKSMDIERIASFYLSNPAFRRTEYNKERCENEDYQDFRGTRIIQIYVERGFPLEIPCYSCLKNQTGLTTVFYMLPSRNFLADIDLHERRERMSSGKTLNVATPVNTWLLHQIKNHQKSKANIYDAQFVFGASRAAGGHAWGDAQRILADDSGHLQIDISWEDWSCCSACCCSVALCGLYANEKKCNEIDSYRTRKGLLSVFILDPNKKVEPNDKLPFELNRMLRLTPYRERGIAVFSSLLLRHPRLREDFYDAFLKGAMEYIFEMSGQTFADYNGVGLYLEKQDCSGMEQKKNCSALAACRGEIVREPPRPAEEEIPVDPCADLPMISLSISESSSSFRFEQNTSYRLRLDGLDMETMKSVAYFMCSI